MTKNPRVWVAISMIALACWTQSATVAFRHEEWFFFGVSAGIASLSAYFVYSFWKQATKKDEPKDLNKTKDLKDKWKEDL